MKKRHQKQENTKINQERKCFPFKISNKISPLPAWSSWKNGARLVNVDFKKSVFDSTFPAPEYIITVTVCTQQSITKNQWIFFFYILVECLSTVHLGKSPQTDRQSLDWGRGERDDGWWGFSETTRKVIWLNLLSVKFSQFILFSTSDNMRCGYYHEIHLIALNEMHTKFSAIDSPSVPIAHQCNQMTFLSSVACRPVSSLLFHL